MGAGVVAGVYGPADIGQQDVVLFMLDAEGLSWGDFRYGGDLYERIWHKMLV